MSILAAFRKSSTVLTQRWNTWVYSTHWQGYG